jgi:hypothetical protein
MKTINFILTLVILQVLFSACSSVRVTSDYESQTDFERYKTFAFYRTGIDQVQISDIDKRRIMRSIETELTAKGFTTSKNPDVLISFFTKARTQIDVYEDQWRPFYFDPYYRNHVSQYTEGTLYIDVIDKEDKLLVWQGIGTGYLTKSLKREKREAAISEFVKKILNKYPIKHL